MKKCSLILAAVIVTGLCYKVGLTNFAETPANASVSKAIKPVKAVAKVDQANMADIVQKLIDTQGKITDAKLADRDRKIDALGAKVDELVALLKEKPKQADPSAPTPPPDPVSTDSGGCGSQGSGSDTQSMGRRRQPIRNLLRFLFRGRRRGC